MPPSNGAARDAAAEPTVALEARLTYRCQMVATRVTRALAPMLQERHGLSVINWRVLAVIGRWAPVSAKDVVARTSTDPYFVSRAIDQLAQLGMVIREVDPDDRRRARLALTARGERVHQHVSAVITAMN